MLEVDVAHFCLGTVAATEATLAFIWSLCLFWPPLIPSGDI